MPKKITSMQFKDRYKLANWLGSQRERIERERIPIGRIIEESRKHMGDVSYTEANVRRLLKDLGISWGRANTDPRGKIIPEIIQRITALENEMAELKNQLGQ